jgi:hypothetical protein
MKCVKRWNCPCGVMCEGPDKIFIDDCVWFKALDEGNEALTQEDVYEYHFNQGRYHRSINVEMSIPSAVDNAVGFRGYMDGWGGSDYKVPVPASYNIDKLHEKGMVTVN